ncbi:MAG: CTP synthase, partial [Alphaproteobacteria bacterium]|nr:CTP synthase [Alphaproteobacteria bacterium]
FLEAIRQFGNDVGDRALFLHVTLLPYIPAAGELKTKPTQHSVKELMSYGIRPDILLCRADREIHASERRKIALFCNLDEEKVIPALDASSIYEVPLRYHAQGLDVQVMNSFGFKNIDTDLDLSIWEDIMHRIKEPEGKVRIAVVGKYTNLMDSYKSLNEALIHGGIANNVEVELKFIESEVFEKEDPTQHLRRIHGILVPGGFGERGAEGKIKAVQYAREHNIPYYGICFGMQLAIIEAARNLCGIADANTTEFGDCKENVVGLMTEWVKDNRIEQRVNNEDKGGTMRLGAYPALLAKGSKVAEIYGTYEISERHRHRYEVNMSYRDILEKTGGLKFSGLSPDGKLPEIIERENHPWFIGVQFHPELKSKPFDPHPLFVSFIKAALDQSRLV